MYSTEVDGEVISFGTSGLLYRSNKLMYDRGTQTLWVQFEGRPAVGPLAESGLELEVLPVTLTTWRDWRELHPDTTVLDVETGVYPSSAYAVEDDPGSIYFDYRANTAPIFPINERSDLLPEKRLILGLDIDGQTKAYPLTVLMEEPIVNDTLGAAEIVVIVTDAGRGGRAYERDGLKFSDPVMADGALTVEDDRGRRWEVDEEALVLLEDRSQRLVRLESRISYWFGWFQFHPTTSVYD